VLVQANGSYPFSNTSAPPSYELEKPDSSSPLEELNSEYNIIFQELKPAERRLYDSLMHSENFLGARGVVTIGFMRAAGIYNDSDGNPLSGESLAQDLSRLNPPASHKERSALNALQNHIMSNPLSQEIDPTKRGNFLDLKI